MHELFEKYQDIIREHEIISWENEPTTFRFQAKLTFKDQSLLFIKEYLFPAGRKYSYHWQNHTGQLLIRWDNAPHWYEIATFPHHKHIGSEKNVEESTEVYLDDVLEFLRKEIK